MADKPITANFIVTREDYADSRAAAGKLATPPSELMLIRVSGAALLLCCFLFLLFLGSDLQRFLLDAMLGILGLFLLGWGRMFPLWLRARAGNDYDENKRLVEACSFSADEKGISIERPRYRAQLPYAMLAGAYEDKKVFLFSLGAGASCFLPKRCLSGEEITRIRAYLTSALQKKFQQEGPQSNG